MLIAVAAMTVLPASASAAAATHFTVSVPNPVGSYNNYPMNIAAVDDSNATDTSYNGTIVLSSSDPGFVNQGPAPAVNGLLTINFVLKAAGEQSITATDQTNASLTGTTSTLVLAGPAARLNISVPSSVSQGTAFNFTVFATDVYGNLATSYASTVHFTSSDVAAALPADTALSNGTGTFAATLNTLPTQTITATDITNPDFTVTSPGILTPVSLQSFSVD
jgi:hypothetical protein